MTESTKSLLASKTVWGVAISMAALVAQALGFNMDESLQMELTDTALKVVEVAGLVFAGYGRVVASKKIG